MYLSPQVKEQIKTIQSTVIVKPIIDYMCAYGLENVVSFIYHGSIMDVDILSPEMNYQITEKEADLEKAVSLLVKHNIEVPTELRTLQDAIQKRKDLYSSIKCFENWLIGHLVYTKFERLNLESVYYSPQLGFLVKFVGYEPIKDEERAIPINSNLHPEDIANMPKRITKRKKTKSTAKLAIPGNAKTPSLNEWMQTNVGYQWVKEQLNAGRAKKDIISEFNEKHKLDPDNFSTRDGKELSASVMSHWAKLIHQEDR